MPGKKVVVIGGGFAGVKVALEFAGNPAFEVTIISPRGTFEYHGAIYRSATGRSPLEAVVPLSEIFAGVSNVRVELDAVAQIRQSAREVVGSTGRTHTYDYLVVAVGQVITYFGIPGMAEHSYNLYTMTGAITLRHRLVEAFRQAKPGVPVNVAVIGAGPTGVEVSADIGNFGALVAERYTIDGLAVNTRLIEGAPRVLGAFSEEASAVATQRLHDVGVEVITQAKVLSATAESVVTDTQTIPADVIVWTAGNGVNPLLLQYPDLFTLDERRRVVVNEYFQTNAPNVFAIGDIANTPYSGMAQTAIHNALWLANNFKLAADGHAQQAYVPQQPEYLVPIGGEWALLQTPDGVVSGSEAWQRRREVDRWVLENFLIYDLADKHWQQGDKLGSF